MQGQLPAPTAQGSFIKTPFPHLLVYALERRLSGTFELSIGAASQATMLVVGGCPAKVRTRDPVHFLGGVMLELGMITPEQLQMSLDQIQQNPRLQGQVFLELGFMDQATLESGLRAQVERKVEHLFGLSSQSMFTYYDGVDLLQSFGGPPAPIDPFPVLWRGVRETPAWEHVDATLRRIGNALLRVSNNAQVERFAFGPQEQEVLQMLRQRPTRMVDVTNIVGPNVSQILIYFLMIMKQVELVDATQPHAQQLPQAAPGQPAPPPSGQAFARVPLKRQPAPAPSRPLVVEEIVSGANDERTSSPGMPAPVGGAFGMQQPPTSAFGPPIPTPATPMQPVTITQGAAQAESSGAAAPAAGGGGGLLDIGSMITQTIQQSSMPPAMPNERSSPSVPPAAIVPGGASMEGSSSSPASSSGSIPTAPASQPGNSLTAEQSILKSKILERAVQITSQDYFQMLGLDREATPEQVQKAFFSHAKVWHPDRLPPALIDVKDACSKVFTHITEAHACLMDPGKRQEYMTLLRDGGATPEDQAHIQAILEAATEFQKAEFLLKRNPNDPQVYDIIKRCVMLDPEQADYMATLAWLDAQKPEWLSREKTLEKCLILDRCIQRNQNCERAYFYRGLLYKRAEESQKALKDFKKAAELNPRNLDAMREIRLYNMRGGNTKPPPGAGGPRPSKAPPAETLGGIFGKLFKK